MTVQTGDASLKQATMPGGCDGSSKYANPNPNSYLKSRRLPAKQERRGKILSFLDSSLEDVNYQLPDFSDGPFVHSSQSSHKRKSRRKKAISLSSYHGTTSTNETASYHKKSSDNDAASLSSLTDDNDTPMEEVLRALYASSLTDSDSTSCTDMTSLASIGFNMSSQHTSSFASLLGDEDNAEMNGLDFEGDGEESSSEANDKDRIGDEEAKKCSQTHDNDEVPYVQTMPSKDTDREKMPSVREPAETSSMDDEVSQSSASYYEEEYIEEEYIEEVYSDSEETIEEEYFDDDDDAISYDEIILEEQGKDLDNGDGFVEEVYYYSDEEELFEEVIEDSSDSFDEYIVEEEYQGSKFEASLGIIEEEDDDHSAAEYSQKGNGRLGAAFKEEEVFFEEENEEFIFREYDEDVEVDYLREDEQEIDVYYEIEDDESYIEEEIIPQFEVPVIPAIAAWQEQEEVRALAEDDEPPEIAPRTPRNILMAVLTAAAADFKLRKVPKDHKKRFVPVSEMAACLARLTKLKENVVEAMGRASTVEQDEDWRPTGAPITLLRSLNVRIVTEAAAMGRIMRLKEKVVANYEEPRGFFGGEPKTNIDDLVDDKGRRIFRTSMLVPLHERDVMQESMSRDWNLGILESSTEMDETTVENVKLPTDRVPRFTKPPSCSPVMGRQEIHDSIARGVAEGAWDRRYRLERPHIGLRVTSVCRCQYCEHPSAFQTHAYKKLSERTQKYVIPLY
jgi:AcrR family transcriptional regulator